MQVEKSREALYNDHRDKTFALGSAVFKKHGPVYLVPPAITYRQASRNFASGSRRAFWRIIPILTSEIHRYATNQANNTEQGLGATLRSPQGNLVPAQEIAQRLEAGSLWVHRRAYPMPTAFFGGIKQSSVGGEWRQLGLRRYCDAKTFHSA